MSKKILIASVSFFIFVAVLAGVVFVVAGNKKSKETIVDLGNGWKSYSHEDIGITVKIPADAEVKAGKEGDKKDYFVANFSKGSISAVGTWFNEPWFDDVDNVENIYKYYSLPGFCKNNDGKWDKNSNSTQSRDICRTVKIDNKLITFIFIEVEEKEKKKLTFKTYKASILDKKGEHFINLSTDEFLIEEKITEERQHFTEEDVEGFIHKHIDMVNDLIVSTNFEY